MDDRSIETYDDLYAMFTETSYEPVFDTFMADCMGEPDLIRREFVRGVVNVLDLDEEESRAFAWAQLWGRESHALVNRAGRGILREPRSFTLP